MKILFTSPVMEHPAAGGPQLRIENSIKALSDVCELHVVSGSAMTAGDSGKASREFYQQYCHDFRLLPSLERKLPGNRFLRKLVRIGQRLRFDDIATNAAFIVRHAEQRSIDCVWFGFGNISYDLIRNVRKLAPDLKLVCDTDSVWSRFLLRELPYSQGRDKRKILKEGRAKELEERAWVNMCHVTTAVSEVDAEYYRGLVTDPGRIHIFSNVSDLATYNEVPPAAQDVRRPSIYLAGTFWPSSPMENAARWTIEEVLPAVRKSIPEIQMVIVGKGSDEVLGDVQDPSIVIKGKLPSVLPFLCHADVALVPLKFESGTRFKILEAGACKIPVVSTTLGAEGIPVTSGRHLLIADDAAKFAEAIVQLVKDRNFADGLALRCHELVSKQFSVEYLAEEAKRIIGYLKNA